MAFALLGVMAMQYYFLRQSYNLQSQLFDRSVNEALNNVVAKVSKQDAINFLNYKANVQKRFVKDTAASFTDTLVHNGVVTPKLRKTCRYAYQASTKQQRIAELKDSIEHLTKNTRLEKELDEIGGSFNFQIKVEEYTDEFGQVHHNFIPQITSRIIDPAEHKRNLAKLNKYLDTLQYVYMDPQFGQQVISVPRINPAWVREQDRKKKEQQLKKVQKLLQIETSTYTETTIKNDKPAIIENLAQEYQRTNEPLDQRLKQIYIDTLLRYELNGQGIDLPFSYEVTTAHNDSVIFSKAMDLNGAKPAFIAANTYQMHIFNREVLNDPGNIKLSFPQKNSLILSHMAVTMATTGGLLFVLIFCFGYTIYTILRQKKISEMKTDFINNMTHEFKTPVSTIMIASEALKDAEIAEDKSRVAKLANIIYEENVRLGSHIERVLNIARIERDDFKLSIKPLDVNEMVVTVVDSMQLKLQKHEVSLDLDLCADAIVIRADELHFMNVIYNLVDNAIKYSTDKPQVTITTLLKGNLVVIKVADKGIGMSHDQQSKIFEQFYRIPTGNLHDVKGFGLGLSYVNTIVKRLNGSISVRSEKDKGSEFELKFDKYHH